MNSFDDEEVHSREQVARERMTYRKRPEPHYMTCGPRTRREFLNLIMRI
jgi:hypothetical protein